MSYILLIIGFVLLIKCADLFVDGSVIISEHFGIPAFIIGLTIVAMGTSAPEAAVSITAAASGSNGLALSNVIGSNIFNLLMVIGVSALIKPLNIKSHIVKVDYPISIVATAAVLLMSANFFTGSISGFGLGRIDGIILLLFFTAFLIVTILAGKEDGKSLEDKTHHKPQIKKGVLLAVIGIAGIIGGGKLVVTAATNIALSWGVSESLIGLTIVAIGTSLPELVTSAMAAVKGESDIAVGNVVGSNIFNLLFVLSLSVVVHPIAVEPSSVIDTAILLGITLLAFIPVLIQKKFNRVWAAFFAAIYIVYTVYIIMRQ